MEVKKGENTYNIPGLVVMAGIVTLGVIVSDICETIVQKRKQFQSKGLDRNGWASYFSMRNFPGWDFSEKTKGGTH